MMVISGDTRNIDMPLAKKNSAVVSCRSHYLSLNLICGLKVSLSAVSCDCPARYEGINVADCPLLCYKVDTI